MIVTAAYLLLFIDFCVEQNRVSLFQYRHAACGLAVGPAYCKKIFFCFVRILSSNTLTRIDRWNIGIKSINKYNFVII